MKKFVTSLRFHLGYVLSLATLLVVVSGAGMLIHSQEGRSIRRILPPIGVTTSNLNPLQIAVLHWFDANLTTGFPTGKKSVQSPEGIAFDGANIWVTNPADNTVTKLFASTGANLGTFTVGASPAGVAFDGANIWVTNASGKSVTVLRWEDSEHVLRVRHPKRPLGDSLRWTQRLDRRLQYQQSQQIAGQHLPDPIHSLYRTGSLGRRV